jgi:hypothetical protein
VERVARKRPLPSASKNGSGVIGAAPRPAPAGDGAGAGPHAADTTAAAGAAMQARRRGTGGGSLGFMIGAIILGIVAASLPAC